MCRIWTSHLSSASPWSSLAILGAKANLVAVNCHSVQAWVPRDGKASPGTTQPIAEDISQANTNQQQGSESTPSDSTNNAVPASTDPLNMSNSTNADPLNLSDSTNEVETDKLNTEKNE